nr:unnamed protein product [Callosobruchus chinensis]
MLWLSATPSGGASMASRRAFFSGAEAACGCAGAAPGVGAVTKGAAEPVGVDAADTRTSTASCWGRPLFVAPSAGADSTIQDPLPRLLNTPST